VSWSAIWRVSSTSEIKKLKIGEKICDRFLIDDMNNLNDDESLSASQY
jgi:hypothetical protein